MNGATLALPARPALAWARLVPPLCLALLLALLGLGLAGPLLAILGQAWGADGARQAMAYLGAPALRTSLFNSLWVAALVTAIVIPLAFAFAYALTRSCMPAKGLLRAITLLPLLAPSLLSALALVYWFGNQGLARGAWQALGFDSIYGAGGIVLAQCFATFPYALMVLATALQLADARLYDAARAMGAGPLRRLVTVTLPGARYGLVSAALLVFTLVLTDFGIPKVVGGDFPVLATDVFKLVIGQQDFQRGAVAALLLLAPALLAFGVDLLVQRRQGAALGARAVALVPRPHAGLDAAMGLFCGLVALLMLALYGMALWASLVQLWPYNLALGLQHYRSGLLDSDMAAALANSLRLATACALLGTALVFLGAWLQEKCTGQALLRLLLRLLAMLPMAVPGLVLGLGSIFFFNHPANPLRGLYQSMALLVLCTVVHYYTTAHLTLVTALKAIDGEFEAVAASLKVGQLTTFWRVTLPICLPALLDVARYFFISAMTTISAVVFLYAPHTRLASIGILNLDEAGDSAAAAAMAVLIAATCAAVNGWFWLLGRGLRRRSQAWRNTAT